MKLTKLWNKNFKKGVSSFQIALMGFMIAGAVIGNQSLILFSMVMCIFGYFEPNQERYSMSSHSTSGEKLE